MAARKTIAVLFGGRSAEHEVSVRSAQTVVEALDSNKYSVVLIGIDRDGRWHLGNDSKQLLKRASVLPVQDSISSPLVTLMPTGSHHQLIDLSSGEVVSSIDVLLPMLHGPFGEDGTIQGLAKLANVPCVGAGVLGSAIGMDKDVMKRLLRDAGIPIGKFLVIRSTDTVSYADIQRILGDTVFVKPANMGSSVGVSKVETEEEFTSALEQARKYDRKVIVEEYIKGREIECAVLGNDTPIASVPGEIIANDTFYSYTAKYDKNSTSNTQIPANIPQNSIKRIQELAIKVFVVLECAGLARVDFFYTQTGKLYVNEINTLPGFTSISMYPKMWEASGIPLSTLVDKLIEYALERFETERQLIHRVADANS